MPILRASLAIGLGLVLALAAPATAQKKGGDLIVAQPAGTNTLDPHFTASAAARNMMLAMYETLVTIDENASPIPLLAARWEVLDNGLTYRFELRKGVKFHNGKELTAADVKGSLERFARVSPEKQTLAPVAAIETPDPHVVVIRLKQLDTAFLDRLASPASPTTIIPAEDAAKEVNKTSHVSTGPYQFVEWVPDSHVKLRRFDGYVPSTCRGGPRRPRRPQGRLLRHDHDPHHQGGERPHRGAGVGPGPLRRGRPGPGRQAAREQPEAQGRRPRLLGAVDRVRQRLPAAHQQPEAAAGDPGGPRHGRDHGRRHRRPLPAQPRLGLPEQRLLPARRPGALSTTRRTPGKRRRSSPIPDTRASRSCWSPTRTTSSCTSRRW